MNPIRRAFTLVELLVVISVITLLVTIIVPTIGRGREIARRAACGANLAAIGKAAHMYATNNNGLFPWFLDYSGNISNCNVGNNRTFATTSGGGGGGNTAQWFGLCKGASTSITTDYLKVGSFRCPSDNKVITDNYDTSKLYDFATQPNLHPLSYSLQVSKGYPGRNPMGIAPALSDNDMLVLAADHTAKTTWSSMDTTRATVALSSEPDQANSPNHNKEGQNVLTKGASVLFKTTPLCGVNNDNIWTQATGADIATYTPGQNNRDDTVLMP
ncbi:MAG: type II secretion system protein [Phycisphaerae bacterium]